MKLEHSFCFPARLQVKDSHPEQGKECGLNIMNECLAAGGVLNKIHFIPSLPLTTTIPFGKQHLGLR
jgi:hypothetical protein